MTVGGRPAATEPGTGTAETGTPAPPELATAAWPALAARAAPPILAVPLGATEQHGPHLPLGTDTMVAEALARTLAVGRSDVTVAPALPYGASGEHGGFAGTLSLGTEATAHLLVELVRSADAFAGVVLVCGHGGNAEAVAAADRQLRSEGRHVLAWAPPPAVLAAVAAAHGRRPDAHAGWVETSMLLALEPTLVGGTEAVAGERRPVEELAGDLRRRGVLAVSPSGVLGDPAGATADAGRALLQACANDLAAAVESRWGPARAPGPSPRPGRGAGGPAPPG